GAPSDVRTGQAGSVLGRAHEESLRDPGLGEVMRDEAADVTRRTGDGEGGHSGLLRCQHLAQPGALGLTRRPCGDEDALAVRVVDLGTGERSGTVVEEARGLLEEVETAP